MSTDFDVALVCFDLVQKTFDIFSVVITFFLISLVVQFIDLDVHLIVICEVLSIWRELKLDVLRMVNGDELFRFQVAGLVVELLTLLGRIKLRKVGQPPVVHYR